LKPNRRGEAWEWLAERYLRDRGLTTLARNFHCRLGEIDLVMRDGGMIVFVEVRYRRQSRFGSAIESVTRTKQLKICRAAGIFLSRRPALASRPCRFDVVGISGSAGDASVEWISGAFEGY
jgi:putative endonuclease